MPIELQKKVKPIFYQQAAKKDSKTQYKECNEYKGQFLEYWEKEQKKVKKMDERAAMNSSREFGDVNKFWQLDEALERDDSDFDMRNLRVDDY